MANQNIKDIMSAYKKHIGMVETIQKKQEEIRLLHDNMFNHIKDINELYTLVFKNIYPDKKGIKDVPALTHRYYNYDDKDKILMRIFLNRDGFSFSNNFKEGEPGPAADDRSNYLQSLDPKEFLKSLIILSSIKDEICNSLVRDYKKSIAVRFFDAMDKSGFINIINQKDDFDYLKVLLPTKLKVYYYEDVEMKKLDVDMFENNDASEYVCVNKEKGNYFNVISTQIKLDDLEKLSQIFDEIMEFLQQYYSYLDKQDKVLVSFHSLLKDAFARELIINSLKDAPQKEN